MGACSKGLTPLVIFDKGTVDHARYIKEVLPVALKYGNKVFENVWTFQKDGARPHTHHLTQQLCKENFPSFILRIIGLQIVLIKTLWTIPFGMNLLKGLIGIK